METGIPEPDREPELTALERRLAAWRPAAGTLDRDRMLYDAGRAAAEGEGHRHAWRLATAALAIMTIGLGVLLAHERSQRRALEIALAARAVPSPPSPVEFEIPPIEPPAPSSYFALTARLAANPVDASWLDVEIEREPDHPAPTPRRPAPLRPRDIKRVLDL